MTGEARGIVSESIQQCPQCGEEYTRAVSRCAHCGVALVAAGSVAAEPPPAEFPDTSRLACVRVGPLPWTHALSQSLSELGIEHRVERDTRSEAEGGAHPDRFGGEILYGVWVRPEEHARAVEHDRQLFAAFEPDRAEASEGDDCCPACGERLAPEALSCPGCGLAFG